MNIMGFNIQLPGAGLDLIERYKPVAALLMDVKSEHIAEAREKSPLTEIIFRKEDGKRWREKDPIRWAEAMWADVKDCPPHLVVADNEPLGHAAVHEFAAFDRWQREFMDWIHSMTPMRVGAFSFAEGNFVCTGPMIPDHFPLSMEVADAVFIHEYWKPHLYSDGMEGYHCLRWPYWLAWFEEAGYPDMPIYVTECGITMGVAGGPHDVGYASEEAKAAGVTVETYLADLEEYHRRCCEEPRIRAVLPFIWCPWPGEWGSFVPTPAMTEKMFTFDAPGPTPEPEPPEENDMIKVYDFTHGLGDPIHYEGLDWLRSMFGNVVIQQPEGLQQGDQYWKIIWLDCTVGPTSCIIHTDGEDGQPLQDVLTVFHWSTAETLEEQGYAVLPHGWTNNGVVGPTNQNGDCGPGYGPGAYYDPVKGEEGPHLVWIYDPARPAQCIKGLGMLTGHPEVEGNHLKFNIGYEIATYQGEEPPPPPPPPPGGGYIAELKAMGLRIVQIAEGLELADQVAEGMRDDIAELADLL